MMKKDGGLGGGRSPGKFSHFCFLHFLLIFKDFDNDDYFRNHGQKIRGGSGEWSPQKMFVIIEGGSKRLSKSRAI